MTEVKTVAVVPFAGGWNVDLVHFRSYNAAVDAAYSYAALRSAATNIRHAVVLP